MCNKLSALFYSKRPQELIYKVGKSCKDINIEVFFVLDFTELLVKVLHIRPKIIFVHVYSQNFQLEVVEVFKNPKSPYFVPNVIIVADDNVSLNDYSKCIVFKTAEICEKVKEHEEMIKFNTSLVLNDEKKGNEICNIARSYLIMFGFAAAQSGFSYIIEAIKIIVLNNNIIGTLQHDVYPVIAMKFNTNAVNVERNIRNTIESGASKCKDFSHCELKEMRLEHKKLTNRQFLTLLADKIYNQDSVKFN